MNAVVSLSGAVIADAVEHDELDTYVDALDTLASDTDTLTVVTGAGSLKKYINAVDDFAVPESRKDMIGIAATRLQATMLAAALDANTRIPDSLEDVAELTETHDMVVLGGLLPGQSTDAVAAECAELIDADRLVIATTVDGVYDADPDTADATKFDTLTYDELLDVIRDKETTAGTYPLIDTTAATLIQRSTIHTVVLDGTDPDMLAQGLGDDHGGTVITTDG